MSIPDRLWRVVKGQWAVANERLADADSRLAEASAYEELAAALRDRTAAASTASPATPGATPAASQALGIDPLAASFELLLVPHSADMATVETAYQARLAELDALAVPNSSASSPALEARRSALTAAYDRIRDMLNPTETRFERLEF